MKPDIIHLGKAGASMHVKLRFVGLLVIAISIPISALAALDGGYQELQGAWQVVELVDNGQAIAPEAIPTWLPSGGRIEIVDNALVFTSIKDGQRHARAFSIDAATYPRQINIVDNNQIFGHGIYRIDDGRLVVCLAPPLNTLRPTDFSARENSSRLMMVLVRPKAEVPKQTVPASVASASSVIKLPAPPVTPAASQPASKPLTNPEISTLLLPGTWTFNDAHGAFFLNLDKGGYFSTYRESVETSAFQKVFRKLPLSSGTWKLNNGQVVLTCTSSVYPDRVCKFFPFSIRSVNATELEFVDYAGNAGKATRTNDTLSR